MQSFEVLTISPTDEDDVYSVTLRLTYEDGSQEEVLFASRPDDPYGLGPAVREIINQRKADGLL